MKRVLVCGGAGYIGAHMAKLLAERGHEVTVFDNLSTGHRSAARWGELIEGDVLDEAALARVFETRRIDAVMHFCALSVVSDSVRWPDRYHRNNVIGTRTLLQAMRDAGVDRLIFSSTAAVYGTPLHPLVDEAHPTVPINPYGDSKLQAEGLLADAAAWGLRSVALRYFNAAGADPDGTIGESHSPETHLIPNVLRSALADSGTPLQVFGDDYPTRDGTCIRDYVHVNDLADAHLRALDYLDAHAGTHRFNLGSGSGFSVMEVIEAARAVTGKRIAFDVSPRRPGDPPVLVADSSRAGSELGWKPAHASLESIIETAWRWHLKPAY